MVARYIYYTIAISDITVKTGHISATLAHIVLKVGFVLLI